MPTATPSPVHSFVGGGALAAAQWHRLADGPLLCALLAHGVLVFINVAVALMLRVKHKELSAGLTANHKQRPQALSTESQRGNGVDSADAFRSWRPSQSLARRVAAADETAAKRLTWMSSFVRTDPRQQILMYFNDIAQQGVKHLKEDGEVSGSVDSLLLKAFPKASTFSVWRPTSRDAIRKMMTGEGTGKGLDIKGKSSKHGQYSGNVPFLQIHKEEDKHKIRSLERDETLRIFYKNDCEREEAFEGLNVVAGEMHQAIVEAKTLLSDKLSGQDARKQAKLIIDKWDVPIIESTSAPDESDQDLYIRRIEDPRPGIEMPERLFWEAFVIRKDISRPPGSKCDSGRPSLPAFQDMNFAAMRKPSKIGHPHPVIYQLGPPLCPQSLVIAYEENNQVLPVVSDFDCFLVGTRNVQYSDPLPKDQVDVLTWMIDNIEDILRVPVSGSSWTSRWLEVLKRSTLKGFYPKIPQFGFGDPMSYLIMEHAIGRLKHNGAVRHGAECFNYYFPQELDDEFLVISDRLPGLGKIPWKYVNKGELQSTLVQFIHDGFTFPINPKWILCDGWKSIFDELLESEDSTVKASMNIWYPKEVRERVQELSRSFPLGFQVDDSAELKASADIDMAEFELEHFITMNTKTLFEKIGGDNVVKVAVDDLFSRVAADPELSPFFEGVSMVWLKDHQRRFLKMAFTRIPASIDMAKMLIKKHKRLFDNGLNEKHFDRMFEHLVRALERVGIAEEMVEEAVEIVGPYRAIFAQGAEESGNASNN